MHTWTFSPESKLIRFYQWCWAAEAQDLNFCKLFWGILFSPLAILMRLPVKALVYLIERGNPPAPPNGDDSDDAWSAWSDEYNAWKRAEAAKKKARQNGILRKTLRRIGSFFDGKNGERAISAFLVILITFWVGSYVIACFDNPYLLLIIPVTGLTVLFIYGLDKATKNVKIVNKLRTVGRFFSTGHHSLKEKTCPIIVIEKEAKNG